MDYYCYFCDGSIIWNIIMGRTVLSEIVRPSWGPTSWQRGRDLPFYLEYITVKKTYDQAPFRLNCIFDRPRRLTFHSWIDLGAYVSKYPTADLCSFKIWMMWMLMWREKVGGFIWRSWRWVPSRAWRPPWRSCRPRCPAGGWTPPRRRPRRRHVGCARCWARHGRTAPPARCATPPARTPDPDSPRRPTRRPPSPPPPASAHHPTTEKSSPISLITVERENR